MSICVTNNPLSAEYTGIDGDSLIFLEHRENGFMDVLTAARDMVHMGHKLITHPLSGSIKPGETPYKTLLLSKDAGALDMESLRIIEEAIITARKFERVKKAWSDKVLKDFQLIDFTLIFGKTNNKEGGIK